MSDPIELPDLEEARGDRFARLIAVAAVLATVAAAGIGYLNSLAADAGDRADVDAQRLAVQAFSAFARDRDQAQIQYELFVQRQGQLRNASSALEELTFGRRLGGRADELRLERSRQERLADQTAKTAGRIAAAGGAPVLDPQGPDGPGRDGLFPARHFSRSTFEGLRLTALRDAANEESTRRGAQISSYVVMLAMLAVAVYLFGFSLTPHGRANRRLFASVAGGLTVVAVVWGVFVSTSSPERAPDEAASAYAAGRIANDLEEYDEAVRHFDRAIELRPTFADAYELRADAEFRRGSPQIGNLTTLTREDSLIRAVADGQKAVELGSTDTALLGNLAFNTLLLGLAERSQERFDEAVELAIRAEEGNPEDPAYVLNRAVALLAAGERDDALEAYREGVAQVLRRDDAISQNAYVAAALSDLEATAAGLGGEIADHARALKTFVATSIAAGRPLEEPDGPERELGGIDVIMTPATATVDLRLGDLDTGEDRVSLQWYQRQGDLGWTVLRELSGPVEDFEWTPSLDGTTFVRRSYLAATAPPTCLTTTDYRVEIYVNGRLAGTGRSDPDDSLGQLQAAVDPDIGYAVCLPPNWRPAPVALPGLLNGYRTADSSRAIYIARVGAGGRGGSGTVEERAQRKFEQVLLLLFDDGTLRRGAAEEGSFLGLAGEQIRRYTFTDSPTVIRAGYGFDADGALLAAFLLGSPEYMGTDEPYEVLNSVTER